MDRLKLVVVGDGAVGKTCLLWMYGESRFADEHVPTVMEMFSMHVNVLNKDRAIELFDTAGQEDYNRLRPLAYPGTNVFFVCFSVDQETSFNNVNQMWVPEVRHHVPTAKIILVGTKIDLRKDGNNAVTERMGRQLQRQIKAEFYFECSAKTGEGINALFTETFRWYFSEDRRNGRPRPPKCKFL